jgi:hypothetical protein
MAFLKALQNQPQPPEHEQYMAWFVLYKQGCSEYSRLLRRLKGMNDPASRLQRFDAREKHSELCKNYYAARAAYEQARAIQKLQSHGVNIDAKSIASALGIKIPLSMKDMIKETKQQKTLENMSDDQFEAIAKAAREYMDRPKSVKEQYIADKELNDPTLDDSPLPMDKENEDV